MDYNDTAKTRIRKVPALAGDLMLAIACSLFALAFIVLPLINETPVKPLFVAGLLLFVPGYTLAAMVFPGNKYPGLIERAALSFGLSPVLAVLTGLALYFTPFGAQPGLIAACLAILTIVLAAMANRRRQSLSPDDRFGIGFGGAFRTITAGLREHRQDRALAILLALLVLTSIAAVGYIALVPAEGGHFTEFYLLGPDGKADGYPAKFHTGETKPVIVGIANHEYRNVTYDLVVRLNDSVNLSQLYEENVSLGQNQTWEKKVELNTNTSGTNMRLEFLLYADGNYSAPYRDLHLWVSVSSPVL